ncbi:protein of unknown function [Methylorubrum extorquens]|nr:protein of unknown function [Methylorubrum extorquens]
MLAQLEARHGVTKPILVHAILETAEGVANVDAIASASPRMHGMSLGPADLAASRGMKTTRVGGGHPDYRVLSDPKGDAERASAQQDLWHYTIAKMVDACMANGIKAFYGPFGDFSDSAACEVQFRNAFLMGCAGAWTLHPSQVALAKTVFAPRPGRGELRLPHRRGDARRHRRGDDRRQDAGRRHLEAGQGHRRSRPARGREGSGSRQGLQSALIVANGGLALERKGREAYLSVMTQTSMRTAKFGLGAVVRHRIYPFRGVVFDVDPEFANTEEWWLAIPEDVRPRKDQPFYHLLAENADSEYVAYVSEQNLVPDTSGEALRHAGISEVFERSADGAYRMRVSHAN